jgi:tetratricopeptide (TPR) repeat protein
VRALREGGRHREAIASFEKARSLGDVLLTTEGGTENLPEILARIYRDGVRLIVDAGRTDEGLEASLRALALAGDFARDHPDDLSAGRTLLQVTWQATGLLETKGRLEEALRVCAPAIALGRRQMRDHPQDVELRMGVARLEFRLGMIEYEKGEMFKALKLCTSATELLGDVARTNPLLFSARTAWVYALNDLSGVQSDNGRYTEAAQSALTAIDVASALDRDSPSSPGKFLLGSGYLYLGKAKLKAGSHGEALARLRDAELILERFTDAQALYQLACTRALASRVADPAEGPAAASRQRRDSDRAVETIRRAIAAGFASQTMLKNDPDLYSLRSRTDFQTLQMDLSFPTAPFMP